MHPRIVSDEIISEEIEIILTNLEETCHNESARRQHCEPSFNPREYSNPETSLGMPLQFQNVRVRDCHQQHMSSNPIIQSGQLCTNNPQLHMLEQVHQPQNNFYANSHVVQYPNQGCQGVHSHNFHCNPTQHHTYDPQHCTMRNANRQRQEYHEVELVEISGGSHTTTPGSHGHRCCGHKRRCRHRHLH